MHKNIAFAKPLVPHWILCICIAGLLWGADASHADEPVLRGLKLPDKAQKVLREVLAEAKIPSAYVTRLQSTPKQQAQIMCENQKKGQSTQYGPIGRAVLKIYADNSFRPCSEIIPLMVETMKARISEAGPNRTELMHVDREEYIVFDVAIHSIANPEKFVKVATKHKSVTRFLHPGSSPRDDGSFHFEMLR